MGYLTVRLFQFVCHNLAVSLETLTVYKDWSMIRCLLDTFGRSTMSRQTIFTAPYFNIQYDVNVRKAACVTWHSEQWCSPMNHNAFKMSLPSVTFNGIFNPASPYMEPLNMAATQKRHVSGCCWQCKVSDQFSCVAVSGHKVAASYNSYLAAEPSFLQQYSVILLLWTIYLTGLMHSLPSLNHLLSYIKHRYIFTLLCLCCSGKLKPYHEM